MVSVPGLLFLLGGLEGLIGIALALLGFGLWFLLERKDAGWRGALARTPAAGLAFGLVAPFVAEWTSSALSGGPASGYAELGKLVQRQASELPLMAWTVTLLSCALLPLACARACSERLLPSLGAGAAGALALGVGVALGLGSQGPRGEALAVVISILVGFLPAGIGLGLLTWLGDRLAARTGVAGPRPRAERDRDDGLRWPISLWLAGLAGLWWGGLIGSMMPHRGREAAAIGALKTLVTSQTIFCEGDKDADGRLQFAGSLSELSDAGLIDAVIGGGVKQGYLFRLVVSREQDEHLWCAAADPIEHGVAGDRRFFTNQSGVVWYTTGEPFPLDRVTCQVPPGLVPVGGG